MGEREAAAAKKSRTLRLGAASIHCAQRALPVPCGRGRARPHPAERSLKLAMRASTGYRECAAARGLRDWRLLVSTVLVPVYSKVIDAAEEMCGSDTIPLAQDWPSIASLQL